jgi:hypothetical protein
VKEVFLVVFRRDESEAAIGDNPVDGSRGHDDLRAPEQGLQIARSVRGV